MRKIWKKYFEDLYIIVAVHIRRGNYFGEEVEVRVGKLKSAGKDEITGEMIKGGDERVVD